MPANWDKIDAWKREKGLRFEVKVGETLPTILPFPILEKEPKLPNGRSPDYKLGVEAGVAYVEAKDHTSLPFTLAGFKANDILEGQRVERPFFYHVEVDGDLKETLTRDFLQQSHNWIPDGLDDSKILYTPELHTRIKVTATPSRTGVGAVSFGTVKSGTLKAEARRVKGWLDKAPYKAEELNGAPLILAINIDPWVESLVLAQLNGQGIADLVRGTFYRRIKGQTSWWGWDEAGRLKQRNQHLLGVLLYVEGEFKTIVSPETPGTEMPLVKNDKSKWTGLVAGGVCGAVK